MECWVHRTWGHQTTIEIESNHRRRKFNGHPSQLVAGGKRRKMINYRVSSRTLITPKRITSVATGFVIWSLEGGRRHQWQVTLVHLRLVYRALRFIPNSDESSISESNTTTATEIPCDDDMEHAHRQLQMRNQTETEASLLSDVRRLFLWQWSNGMASFLPFTDLSQGSERRSNGEIDEETVRGSCFVAGEDRITRSGG